MVASHFFFFFFNWSIIALQRCDLLKGSMLLWLLPLTLGTFLSHILQGTWRSMGYFCFLCSGESTKIRPTSIIISEEINRKFLFQELQSLRIFPLGTEWWIFGVLQGRIMNICFSFHFLHFSWARSSSGFCSHFGIP